MSAAQVDIVRAELGAMTAPGVVTDHDQAAAVGQAITVARFAHFAKTRAIHPKVYPPPAAGDGSDVFKAADEGGEGKCTRKEIAKYLMRNQTLRHRLREGWAKFNSNFGTEDIPENHEELDQRQFCALWAEAAAMRKDRDFNPASFTSPRTRSSALDLPAGRTLSRQSMSGTPRDSSPPGCGFSLGATVTLTEEACDVGPDYDWSAESLRPKEQGTVKQDAKGVWMSEDESDGIMVHVVGPRGNSDWYCITDLALEPPPLPAAGAAAGGSPRSHQNGDIAHVFRRLDRGHKGYLSREDFAAAFSVIPGLDEDSIGDLFCCADHDHDRKVTELEWKQFAVSFPTFVASAAEGSAQPFKAAQGTNGHRPGANGHKKAVPPVPAVDAARGELAGMTKPGVVTDFDLSAAAAQKITSARFAHFAKSGGAIYPAQYPPPAAGDGSDVFKAADEGGEGKCTRKEIAKYLMRNQTLRHRLREGWAKFNTNFGTEDIPENHEELDQAQFCALWAEAAAMRADA